MLKAPPMKRYLSSSLTAPSFKAHVNYAFDLQYQYFPIIQDIWASTHMQSCDLLALLFQKTTE